MSVKSASDPSVRARARLITLCLHLFQQQAHNGASTWEHHHALDWTIAADYSRCLCPAENGNTTKGGIGRQVGHHPVESRWRD